MMRRVVFLCCSSLFFAFALSADTFSFGFSTSSALGGDNDCTNTGGCAAGATITTGNGTLVVQLESFALNPVAPGQLISGIFITLGTAPTSDSLTSQSGQLIDLTGTVVSDVSGNPTHWGTSKTGATICLETAGTCANAAAPTNMIIGNSSSYSNSNGGLNNGNFDPYIQGIGTFDLNLGGITASTTVTSVTFEFGTGPDGASGVINTTCTAGTVDCGPTTLGSPVPEPMSLVLLGSITIGLASIFRKKLRGTA